MSDTESVSSMSSSSNKEFEEWEVVNGVIFSDSEVNSHFLNVLIFDFVGQFSLVNWLDY